MLDLSLLRETFVDDDERIRQILEKFLSFSKDTIPDILGCIAENDAEATNRMAHRFKSSALTVGAFSLAETCRTLESAAGQKDWAMVRQTATHLSPELARVSEAVARL